MNNRTYAGEIAHNLSARVKTSIVKRAAELDVKLLNAKSKLKSDEKKKEWFQLKKLNYFNINKQNFKKILIKI